MFTGIVEEVGTVVDLVRGDAGVDRLHIRADVVHADASVGDSIAVSGVCLTVIELPEDGFVAEVMGETLRHTALGDLASGAPVNLERALAVGARLGGHIVQGHVDGVTTVTAVDDGADWTTITFELPPQIARYVAHKGSIALDGISLTVAAVDDTTFAIGVIPHTLAATTLGQRRPGDRVNVEVDVLAKYTERMLRHDEDVSRD